MSNAESDESVSRRGFLKGAAVGTALLGGAGSAAAQEGGNNTGGGGGGGNESGGGGGGGGGTTIVEVGPNGEYVFSPGTDDPLVIQPGTTVKWVWKSDNHNIVVEEKPEDSSWSGVEQLHNQGYTATHTFEVKGSYHYFCQPHKSLGMVADIEVTDETPAPAQPAGPVLPDSAKTLGIATMTAMLSTLAFAYFFIKYGGDYPETGEE